MLMGCVYLLCTAEHKSQKQVATLMSFSTWIFMLYLLFIKQLLKVSQR